MWIGSLALMGVFPLSGFWSKDSVLLACWESGQYAIFAVALVSVIFTAFYSIRLMGLAFHTGPPDGDIHREQEFEDHVDHADHVHGEEGHWLMVLPYGILAVLTVLIGLVGPLVSDYLSSAFQNYYVNSLGLTIAGETVVSHSVLSGLSLEIVVALASTLMIVIGAIPAYKFYISSKSQPETVVAKSGILKTLYNFLWNRWYINAFYTRVFVEPSIRIGQIIQQYIETPLNQAINSGIPIGFKSLSSAFRKLQTGKLRINMAYVLVLIVVALILLWLGGFI